MKEKPGRGIQCEKHEDLLKLYCKEDQILLCVVCEKSQVHRGHTVVPREEAAQEYRETIAELMKQLQSAYEKLHLLEGKEGKHLPERARDMVPKKLKRPTEKSQSPGSERKSFSPGRKIAVETELQGHKERESTGENVSGKPNRGSSHVVEETQTPKRGISETSQDLTPPTVNPAVEEAEDNQREKVLERTCLGSRTGGSSHVVEETQTPKRGISETSQDLTPPTVNPAVEEAEDNQMGVADLRQRFQVSTSPKESLDSGLRSRKHVSPAGQTRVLRVGSKENRKRESTGENVSGKPNRGSSHVVEETQTPKRGISETSQDLTPPTVNPAVEEAEDNQMGVADLRQRFQVSTSPKESLDSGLRSRKHVSPAGQTRVLRVGSKENRKRESTGENVSGKPNRGSSHVVEETQTPKRGISETSQDLTPPTVNPAVEEAEDNQRESTGENVSGKPNRGSSHVVEETQTPKRGISETSQDLTPPTVNPAVEEAEDNQMGVADLRQRFEVSTSPKESLDSGLRSGKHVSPAGQTRILWVGSKENRQRESTGENVSGKPNRGSSHVVEETQTPKRGISETSQDLTPPTVNPAVEEAEDNQRESTGENVSGKPNRGSSHVVEETQTPKRGISETSQDLTPPTVNPAVEEAEDNQLGVADLRQSCM
ncbi:unnamed protein product [Caretta caretta]